MSKVIFEPLFVPHGNVDLPEIEDISPQHQAMDRFISNFSLAVGLFDLSADGKTLTYKLRGTKLMVNYISMARVVIILQALPLSVRRDHFEINGVVFEDNMILTYNGDE